MRALWILAPLLFGGCSVLDQLDFSGGRQLDPTKVYLGRSVVMVRPRETERYACVDGPLRCESFGIGMECRCAP